MAKKTAKQSRKELLKSDDAFIQAANTGAEWITENRTWVIGAVGAIVLVVTGGIVAQTMMASAASEQADALAAALAVYNAELVPEAEANPDGDPPTFATEDARREAARAAFEKLVGDSGAGLLAQFYAADLAEAAGETDAAMAQFDALLEKLSPTHDLYFLAIERAAYAHERTGDLDGAMAIWGRLTTGNAFYRDRAAFQRARLLEAKGEKQKAAELYASMENEFPESAMVDSARKRLALLEEQGIAPPEAPEAPDDAPGDVPGDDSEGEAESP